MRKLFISFCLSLCFIAPALSLNSSSEPLGSQDNPLTIDSLGDLKDFRNAVNRNGSYKSVPMQQEANSGGAGLYFVLTTDIDLGGEYDPVTDTWGGAVWTPIGTETYPFRGNFNGRGHKISNMLINRPGFEYQGFFGYVSCQRGSVVLDSIIIESGSVSGLQYVGGIAGYAYGNSTLGSISITNCVNKADIQGEACVAGIVGTGYTVTFTNCLNVGNVVATIDAAANATIGGICGRLYSSVGNSQIGSCLNLGMVSGDGHWVGGLAGYIQNATVLNSVNLGNISGYSNPSFATWGGLVGQAGPDGKITESLFLGQVLVDTTEIKTIGGIVGYCSNGAVLSVCYYDKQLCAAVGGAAGVDVAGQAVGRLTADLLGTHTLSDVGIWTLQDGLYPLPAGMEAYPEALAAANPAIFYTDDTADSISRAFTVGVENKVSWSNTAGKLSLSQSGGVSLLELGQDTLLASYNGKTVKTIYINITDVPALGSDINPLIINNEDELISLGNAINNPTQYTFKGVDLSNGGKGLIFQLGQDITLTKIWTPIGTENQPFKGQFAGFNYAISHVSIPNGGNNQGLFGVAEGAEIKDLYLRDVEIKAQNNVGGLAGQVKNTTVSNCHILSHVHGQANVGGLIGSAEASDLSLLTSTGRVWAENAGGGLCGAMTGNSKLYTSLASGCITGGANVGGLAGTATDSEISYAASYAFVDGTNAGGICGQANANTVLTHCVSGAATAGNGLSGNGGTISHCFFDNRMCSGSINDANGKPTTDMLGTALSRDLDASHFVFTENLYPLPLGLDTTSYAICVASPILLVGNDKANSVTTPFNTCVDNGVVWESARGYVDLGADGTTSLLTAGTDTLYAKINGQRSKLIVINIEAGFAQPGSYDNPLFITSKDELAQFRTAVNTNGSYKNVAAAGGFSGKYIALKANDINLADTTWEPIGTRTYPFCGTFEGNNFEVNNVNTDTTDYQGFFGFIKNATINNLHIGSGTIVGNTYVGGICAKATGSSIIACGNNAYVSGNDFLGGICGSADGSKIQKCVNTGKIINAGTNNNAGGIVGNSDAARGVLWCLNAGFVGGNGGGIAGTNAGSIEKCLNVAPVDRDSAAAIVHTNNGTVLDCYSDRQMCLSPSILNGTKAGVTEEVTKVLTASSIFSVTDWLERKDLYPTPVGTEGTNIGRAAAAPVFLANDPTEETVRTIQSSFEVWAQDGVLWKRTIGCVDVGVDGVVSLLATGIDTLKVTIDGKVYKQLAIEVIGIRTLGSAENPLLINNLDEFRDFATAVNSGGRFKAVSFADGGKDKYIQLTADIELGPWTAIGTQTNPFKGNFQGSRHKLTSINVNTIASNQGLFGYIEGARLENIALYNGTISGSSNVGAIFGSAENSIIENCLNASTVSGSVANIGGIGGYLYETTITSCINIGEVDASSSNGAYYTGGIVGYMEDGSEVAYCVNAGYVRGANGVGGLAGAVANNSTLENSLQTGGIVSISTSLPGALYGFSGASTVNNCFADQQMCGNVSAPNGVLKSTVDMTDNTLWSLHPIFGNSKLWFPVDSGYPTPRNLVKTDIAFVAATPVFLNGTETIDSVVNTAVFYMPPEIEGFVWENTVAVPNFTFDADVDLDGYAYGFTECAASVHTATMTASRNGASKRVDLRIMKVSTDTVFYADEVCRRIKPTQNEYLGYGFTVGVDTLPVGENIFSRTEGKNVVGCDSVFTLKLTVLPIDTVYYTASIRESSTYTQGGYTYHGYDFGVGADNVFYEEKSNTGLVRDTVTAFHIRVLNDSLVTKCTNNLPYTFNYTYNGAAQTKEITLAEAQNDTIDLLCQHTTGYLDDAFGIAGVTSTYDSILTVTHKVNPAYVPANVEYYTTCSNDPYEWPLGSGKLRYVTGTYTDPLVTEDCGCDSIMVLELTVNPAYVVDDYQHVKRRDMPYYYRDNNGVNNPVIFGIDTTKAGIHTIEWKTALDCDSIVRLHLDIAENAYDTTTVTACGNYTWYGQHYYASGTYTYTVANAAAEGCDSIYVLNLTVLESETVATVQTIAFGTSYTWEADGQEYSQSGIYEHSIKYKNFDCDSIVYQLTLHVVTTPSTYEKLTICKDELPYEFGDTTFDENTESGIYYVYKRYDGDAVDSKVTLDLTVTEGPEIDYLAPISTIDVNTPLILPSIPDVTSAVSLTGQHWEISGDDFETVIVYSGQPLDETYNGWQLRFVAENICGIGYSNAVSIYLNGYEPPRIYQMWDDVIVCDNSEERYSQFQWYRDGMQIAGAMGQYYVEEGGLSGTYHVVVFDSQLGVKRTSEELTIIKSALATEKRVTVYPNPSSSAEPILLKITGFTDSELRQATLYVYDIVGKLMYRSESLAEQQELHLPAGQYVSTVVLESGKRINTKIVVIK